MNVSQAIAAAHSANGAPPMRALGACTADGCPCVGSVDLGNTGRFFCSWHAWATPDRWPHVTDGLLAHRWLIELIGELAELYGRGSPWVPRARSFWADEQRCAPTDVEVGSWNLYCWRLREELSWRIGIRKDRPMPRVPMGEQPQWRSAKAAASGVLEAAKAGEPVPREAITQALVVTGDLSPLEPPALSFEEAESQWG